MSLDYLDTCGYPMVIVNWEASDALHRAVHSLARYASGIKDFIVLDNSGSTEYRKQLDRDSYQFSVVSVGGQGSYLETMRMAWRVAGEQCARYGSAYFLLWASAFQAVSPIRIHPMAHIMNENPALMQLNLQDGNRVSYDMEERSGLGTWLARFRPFFMSPGLVRADALRVEWPDQLEAENTTGGAQGAMSLRLEEDNWYFGWSGEPGTISIKANTEYAGG